jgi:hypothetical protein
MNCTKRVRGSPRPRDTERLLGLAERLEKLADLFDAPLEEQADNA